MSTPSNPKPADPKPAKAAGAGLPIKKRTRARELCLQFLYQVDLVGEETLEGLNNFLRDEEKDRDTRSYAETMIRTTCSERTAIDDRIQSVAQNWKIHRMAVIDRNVLRLATYELLYRDDIPPKVAINEAIELGKRFSTSNSGAFINGILDKIKSGLPGGGEDGADGGAPSEETPTHEEAGDGTA